MVSLSWTCWNNRTYLNSVKNWQESIRICGNILLNKNIVKQDYIDKVIEEYNNTNFIVVFGEEMIITHSTTENGVNKIGLSMLVVKDGVVLPNGNKIHIVCMLAAVDKEKHLKSLIQLSDLATNKSDINKIINATNNIVIFNIIKQYSDSGKNPKI